jgi:Cupredoxin-like domain
MMRLIRICKSNATLTNRAPRAWATRRPLALSAALMFGSLPGGAFAAEPTISLTLKDHKFTPQDVTIPAETRVRLLVKNLDATPAEFESDDFKAEKIVPTGKEVTIFIGPLKAGSYEFHDEYHEAESKSRLIVQ